MPSARCWPGRYPAALHQTGRGTGSRAHPLDSRLLPALRKRHAPFAQLLAVGHAAVEATDLIFALDSIPAVLAVTRNSWIAFTSNIFAVLGLRSLYFALSSMLDRFHMLHYGLACILGFVAFKMLAVHWIDIPAGTSLIVIVSILALFAVVSRIVPESAPPSNQRI